MMLSIQNNAFSENWRDGFARISMLPQGVSGHQCFTANGFVYCAGGYGVNGKIDKVWYAKINSDGYLGEWNETTSLPYTVSGHQCFAFGSYAYCVGGRTNKVWYAHIDNDGTLGKWQETKTFLGSHGIYDHQCFVTNNFIYCTGGEITNSNGSRSFVWYTVQNNDGSLEKWQETEPLPKAVSNHDCFLAKNYVYCTGGKNSGLFWYNNINFDGTFNSWQETYTLLSTDYCFTDSSLVYSTDRNGRVYYTNLNADGTLRKIQETTALSYSVENHQCITIGEFVYCIGGYSYPDGPRKDVLIHFNPFIIMQTHPNGNNWYITKKYSFYLSDQVKTPYGYYYIIDNNSDTLITAVNSVYTTNRSITITSGTAIEHGKHYLHIALADKQNIPQNTLHLKFNTYAESIELNSPTHSNQSEWFGNPSFQIDFNNKNTNLTYRYVIDDYSDTIPSSSSAILDSINRVFVNQQPGIHYLHVQVFDELGTTGQTLHFRYNIYDSDEPKPAPLPVVTKLNVDPTSVTKDGTISIEGTIEIK